MFAFIKCRGDLIDILFTQLERLCGKVISLVAQVGSFRYDDVAPAHPPVQDDLRLTAAVLRSHGLNHRLLGQVVTLRSHLAAESAKWAVGYRGDIIVMQELDQVRLGARWIQTDLVGQRFVLCISHDVREQLSVEVGDCEAFA